MNERGIRLMLRLMLAQPWRRCSSWCRPSRPTDQSAADYATRVAPLFKKYCAGCHNDDDREGKFSLETYASLQRGTAHGPALLPGDPKGSRMIRVLTGAAKPMMPPEDEPRPAAGEIALIAAWIESGAHGPQGQEPDRLALVVPKIPVAREGAAGRGDGRDARRPLARRRARRPRWPLQRTHAPLRFAGTHAGTIPRQGDRLAFHPRRQAARHGLGRRRIGWRRGDLERRRRHARQCTSRATATSSTMPSSPPMARCSPPAAMTRRSSSGTRLPPSTCAPWKGTPARSTMLVSVPTAASS